MNAQTTDDELEELFDAASFHYDFAQFDAEEKADILAAMRLAMEKERKEERRKVDIRERQIAFDKGANDGMTP